MNDLIQMVDAARAAQLREDALYTFVAVTCAVVAAIAIVSFVRWLWRDPLSVDDSRLHLR